MAETYNVVKRQNIDWVFKVTANSGGAPIDLTGWAIKLEAKNTYTNTAVLTLQIGTGITVPTPATGEAFFRATGTQIASIPVGTYLFNVKAGVSTVGSEADEWVVGTLTIEMALA